LSYARDSENTCSQNQGSEYTKGLYFWQEVFHNTHPCKTRLS